MIQKIGKGLNAVYIYNCFYFSVLQMLNVINRELALLYKNNYSEIKNNFFSCIFLCYTLLFLQHSLIRKLN